MFLYINNKLCKKQFKKTIPHKTVSENKTKLWNKPNQGCEKLPNLMKPTKVNERHLKKHRNVF